MSRAAIPVRNSLFKGLQAREAVSVCKLEGEGELDGECGGKRLLHPHAVDVVTAMLWICCRECRRQRVLAVSQWQQGRCRREVASGEEGDGGTRAGRASGSGAVQLVRE